MLSFVRDAACTDDDALGIREAEATFIEVRGADAVILQQLDVIVGESKAFGALVEVVEVVVIVLERW